MRPLVPRRFRRLPKHKRKKVKFCPWDGTAWIDRSYCSDYCRQRYEDLG